MGSGATLGILALSADSTLSSILSSGSFSNVAQAGIQGSSGNANTVMPVELKLGRYITFDGQLSNADDQTVLSRGVTQNGLTLTTSTSTTTIFNGTADLDPYARGQAMASCRLNDTQALVCAPIVGTGNVFNVVTYNGDSSNVTIDLTFNDGDTTNYIDRFPKFHVLKVTGTVYTIASTGLSRSGAFPYARVWDIDISGGGSATSRGIIYPMGTSGSGNGIGNLVPLGTVGGKECFALFYPKSASSAGVLYYAVYEYNTSTNTLVEVVGDTLYESGSNLMSGHVRHKIEDGRGIVLFIKSSVTGYLASCRWDGSTFTVDSQSTFGSSSPAAARMPGIRPYFNGNENSTTQFLVGAGVNNNVSGTTAKFNIFPANYNFSTNTFDTSKFNTADSLDVLTDSGTSTTFSGVVYNLLIGQQDEDFCAVVTDYRDSVGTYRGSRSNAFKIRKT
jgi:hypothetical protein